MRERWLTVGPVRLFATEQGGGAPFIFLHGGLADHRAVLPIVGPLAKELRLILPDQRGSGRSWSSEPLTFDTLADDLARWLDHLGLEQCIVGGISSGSGVAVRFALRHPQRTRALVVLYPVYAGVEVGYTPEQRSAFAAMDAVASQAVSDGIEVLRPLYFEHLPEPMAERAWSIASEFEPGGVVATSRFVASGVQPFDAAEDLRRIGAPTLLVRGNDAQHPSVVSDLYARWISDCSVAPAGAEPTSVIGNFCLGLDE